jgi:putative ABC transport system permease protein
MNADGIARVFVKVSPEDLQQTIGFLGARMAEFSPEFPFEYQFLDDAYNRMYQTEIRLSGLFSSFTLLALIIACLGLLGLATFSASQRVKEIGVRKVLGASHSDILLLLSKDFTRLVLVGFVLGAPVAYFVLNTWLEGFAYRVAIGWSTIALAGGLAMLLAWLTISYQSIRFALINPVKSLRYE